MATNDIGYQGELPKRSIGTVSVWDERFGSSPLHNCFYCPDKISHQSHEKSLVTDAHRHQRSDFSARPPPTISPSTENPFQKKYPC
jgi:hypothetical protein